MKPDTLSLFERELHDQIAAAREAVTEAAYRGEPLLIQAARSHLDGLLDLARRNGVPIERSAEDLADETAEEPVA
jgi:hypothetical protein